MIDVATDLLCSAEMDVAFVCIRRVYTLSVLGFVLVVFCLSVLLSPRTLTSIEDSDVYRMLQKDQEEPQVPRQSGSFKALQDFVDSDGETTRGHHTGCENPSRQTL